MRIMGGWVRDERQSERKGVSHGERRQDRRKKGGERDGG